MLATFYPASFYIYLWESGKKQDANINKVSGSTHLRNAHQLSWDVTTANITLHHHKVSHNKLTLSTAQ